MSISLGTPKDTTPSVKLPNLHDELIFAVVDEATIPLTEYGSKEPVLGKDGTPRQQEVIYGLVISANGAVVGPESDRRAPEPGELIAIYAARGGRWEWSQAKDGKGGLNVGDVGRHWFDRTEPSEKAGNNDRKVRTFQLRAPKPEEANQTALCEAAYQKRQAAPTPLGDTFTEPAAPALAGAATGDSMSTGAASDGPMF